MHISLLRITFCPRLWSITKHSNRQTQVYTIQHTNKSWVGGGIFGNVRNPSPASIAGNNSSLPEPGPILVSVKFAPDEMIENDDEGAEYYTQRHMQILFRMKFATETCAPCMYYIKQCETYLCIL